MNTRIILATLAFGLSAHGQSSPPPLTITLEIPIEAAGHSFQLIEDNGSAGLMFGGLPVYDSLTQKFLIIGTPPYVWTSPILLNDSLGNSPFDYSSNGFYITEPLTWQPSLFDAGTIGYAVADSLVNHSFALVAPGIGAFPVTKLPVLGSTVNDSDGNPVFVSMGFFNAFTKTEIGSLSSANTMLVDLTAQKQSVANATDLRDPAMWATRTVAMPTRAVTFQFGTVDSSYQLPSWTGAYTLHTSSGSLQSLTPYTVGIYQNGDSTGTLEGYEVRVSGQAGILEEYWLTRDGTTESTPHFFMGLGIAEVVQSAAPFTPPVSSFGTVSFMIGEDHYNESLAISQGGNTIPLDLDWTTAGQNMLVTWDHSGNEVQYDFNYYSATFDQNAPWELVNAQLHSYHQTTDLRDGFTPFNPIPPAGNVSLAIPSGRYSALNAGQIKLRDVGQNTEWTVTMSDPAGNAYWMGFNIGTPDEFWTTIPYHSAFAPSASVNSTDMVELVDYSNGDVRSFAVGLLEFDPAAWVPELNITITLPAQRWMNNLVVRTAFGSTFDIERGAIQGLWSGGYFTSYGTFSATTKIHAGLDWWIHDSSTDETANNNAYFGDFSGWVGAGNATDSDGDGLPDWYEYIIGTASDNTDTDGDGISDHAEAAAGTNPNSSAPILTVTSPVGAVWLN